MTVLPDALDSAAPVNNPPHYHPPVLVEHGSARDLTRSNNAGVVPDGGGFGNSVGIDDGGFRAPSATGS